MNNYNPVGLGDQDYIFIGYEIWTKKELAEWWRREQQHDRQTKQDS